jgi:hypothetical protein
VLLLGRARFANVDMRIRVKGGGHVSQIYGAPPAVRPPATRRWRQTAAHAPEAAQGFLRMALARTAPLAHRSPALPLAVTAPACPPAAPAAVLALAPAVCAICCARTRMR